MKKKKRFEKACKEDIRPDLWAEVELFYRDCNGLYIFGGVGSGKTHLCHAIKNSSPWGLVQIVQINELLMKIRGTFQKGYEGPTEETIIDSVTDQESWSTPFRATLFDDLGVERPTEWAQEVLYTIVDRRYRNERKTVFTSNYSLDELSERLGDRIASRIGEMCRVIKLEAKDRRVK